jgi:hypothetical protein
LNRKKRKKFGNLPPKEVGKEPWKRVNIDLIGPYKVRTLTKVYELQAMTMIDSVTRWLEIAPIEGPKSEECMEAFDNTWLCR